MSRITKILFLLVLVPMLACERRPLYDPESAEFDMEFYVKRGLNNLKVNTSEYVFQSEGVRKENGCQRLCSIYGIDKRNKNIALVFLCRLNSNSRP